MVQKIGVLPQIYYQIEAPSNVEIDGCMFCNQISKKVNGLRKKILNYLYYSLNIDVLGPESQEKWKAELKIALKIGYITHSKKLEKHTKNPNLVKKCSNSKN